MFKSNLSNAIHKIFNYLGLEIRLIKNLQKAKKQEKQKKTQEEERKRYLFLENFKIKTVIDIGANEGQFAQLIREKCPESIVYSFEPLPSVYDKLCRLSSQDSQIRTFNLALGNEVGTTKMFESAFSPSSSLLPMADLHKAEWPQSATGVAVEVELNRLDDWAADNLQRIDDLLIKLDVQGYELNVIKGGSKTLKQAKLVIVEVSFDKLYENQASFDDIYTSLRNLDFVYRGNLEQFRSKINHKILFADAIFENVNI